MVQGLSEYLWCTGVLCHGGGARGLAIHGCCVSRHNSGVQEYSDIGGIGVAIHVLSWTVSVTMDFKVETRPIMARLDTTCVVSL